jgi:hypothetical protein
MINHKHKFIFIHIPKCGGVSVEKHLGWGGVRHHTMEFYMKKYAGLNLDEYYNFTFVRNPGARLVSWYFYHIKLETSYPRDFKEWVKTGMKSHWNEVDGTYWGDKDPINCQSWIADEKQYNFIGKLENLQEDFNTICDKIGIPQQQLPRINSTKHKHCTEYYDDGTRQIVAEKCAKDIEYFNYQFGE